MFPEIERTSEEELEQSSALEPMGKVIIHNDDITPYDFVIAVLLRFFALDAHQAELVTWTAHTSGHALVNVFPLSDAQRRVGRAHFAASLEGYPLTFTVETE